ncbi:MAG: Xaa-Pro peptidase family protein [Trueperaceae bacterium]
MSDTDRPNLHAPFTQEPPGPLAPATRRRLRSRLLATLEPDRDGILLLEHDNVVWASGFDHSRSERPVGLWLPADGDVPTLFVPRLEQEHAAQVDGVRPEVYDEYPGLRPPLTWIHERIVAGASGSRVRVAVDAIDLRWSEALRQQGADLIASDAAVRARSVKEPEELALIRLAAGYADRVLFWLLEEGGARIDDGASEADLLQASVSAARQVMDADLAERFPASTLHLVGTVHSGPQAALPHGRPGPRRPTVGEVVIAGIGAKVGGYHAESGATFVVGEPDADTARCLRTADACGRAAIAALRPGVRCDAVNEAAWGVLREAGLGDAIRHRIGHGMGVQGHEAPWLAPGDGTEVAPGMAFSNEPGIYRPGVDGYRTIDSMIVHDDRIEIPSRFQATVPWDRRTLASYASR